MTPDLFFRLPWRISGLLDRTGVLLGGPFLQVSPVSASNPVLPGCIQILPNGRPLVILADGPTVGGYTLLGMIDPTDLPRFAQACPNSQLTFSPCPPLLSC